MAKRQSLDISKAQARSATSEAAEETLQRQQMKEGLVPLNKIGDRIGGDTRTIKPKHVEGLMESIAILGLIAPLTVDRHYRLLAGGHRKAALEKLAKEDPKRFKELFSEGVPVNIMDIDGETDTVRALQIEVEENTQRKNYTPNEIREAARKLEEAGYEQLKGRPAQGQKSINRELSSVFGLSRRYITTIMNEPKQGKKSAHDFSLFSKISRYRQKTEAFRCLLAQNQDKSEITTKFKKEVQELRKALKEVYKLLNELEEEPSKEEKTGIREEYEVDSDQFSKEKE
jgi:ParB-like chromosome segregation protein Spo0J